MISHSDKIVKRFEIIFLNFFKFDLLRQNGKIFSKDFFMRIDKFLKVSRILKRRTLAAEACDGGRVKINGRAAKPSHEVKAGDVVEIGFNSGTLKFTVNFVKETVRKEEAESMYTVTE